MAVHFDEELIRVEYVIGEEVVTESVTGTIEIPDVKPPAERVVEVKVFGIDDLQTTIEEGGVELTAEIDVGVVYVGLVDEPPLQPVHFVEGRIPITNFVDVPGAEPGMNVFADVNVRRVSFQLIDERTIEVTVVIHKFVKVTEYRQITVITGVEGIPEEDIRQQLLKIEEVIGETVETVVVSGRLPVPDILNKPPIERILNATAEIRQIDAEITEDGVIIDGSIFGGAMYVAEVEEPPLQPVHFIEGEFNFSQGIDIPGVQPGMNVHTNVIVQRVSFDEVTVNGETTVELNVVIRLFVKVTEQKQVNIITDIVSELVEVDRDLLRVEEVIGEDIYHESITRPLTVPEEKPAVLRVLEPFARVIDFEAMTEPGGVMIDAEIEAGAMYVGDVAEGEPQQPVHFVETPDAEPFNFDNFVDIPGAEPGMNAYVELEVTRVSVQKLGVNNNQEPPVPARRLEFTIVVRKFAKVTEFRQLEIITDIVEVAPVVVDDCPPSYVVYVVQPGDTLYKIARRYRTTVDALIQANPSIDPHNLQIGQKICVPKKVIDPRG
ncbi:SPOCS domain-containing protein [Natronospora cellulosivora (SeqCode)]